LHSGLTFDSRASKVFAHRTTSVPKSYFARVAAVASLCISVTNADHRRRPNSRTILTWICSQWSHTCCRAFCHSRARQEGNAHAL